jgi:NTP pyrophosphatase (non-canonical NTP hydrolase)
VEAVNLDEYQEKALRTASVRKGFEIELMICGLGITGEAGEAADVIKKFAGHGHSLDVDKLKKELGDTLWYIARIAALIDLKLSEVAQGNIDKLLIRYKDGFSTEASIARVDTLRRELHAEIFDGDGSPEHPYTIKGSDGVEARATLVGHVRTVAHDPRSLETEAGSNRIR